MESGGYANRARCGKTVALWRNRFAQRRLAGIEKDAPRGGRPAMTKQKLAAQIVKTTITQQPPTATHWSTRTLAEHLCTSPSMVQRVWKETNLQPPCVNEVPPPRPDCSRTVKLNTSTAC